MYHVRLLLVQYQIRKNLTDIWEYVQSKFRECILRLDSTV